jgi:adenosine deaminase
MEAELGLSREQALQLARNSFTASFLSEDLIATYIEQVNQYGSDA